MTQRTNDHHDYSRFASTNRHCQPHGRNANAGYSGVHDGGVDPVLVSVIENAVSSSTKHSIYLFLSTGKSTRIRRILANKSEDMYSGRPVALHSGIHQQKQQITCLRRVRHSHMHANAQCKCWFHVQHFFSEITRFTIFIDSK